MQLYIVYFNQYVTISIYKICPPLFRTSMHCNAALAVTWLSHNSQYIFCFGLDSKQPQYPQKRCFLSSLWLQAVKKKKNPIVFQTMESDEYITLAKNNKSRASASSLSHLFHHRVQKLYTQQAEREQDEGIPSQIIYRCCPWIKPL